MHHSTKGDRFNDSTNLSIIYEVEPFSSVAEFTTDPSITKTHGTTSGSIRKDKNKIFLQSKSENYAIYGKRNGKQRKSTTIKNAKIIMHTDDDESEFQMFNKFTNFQVEEGGDGEVQVSSSQIMMSSVSFKKSSKKSSKSKKSTPRSAEEYNFTEEESNPEQILAIESPQETLYKKKRRNDEQASRFEEVSLKNDAQKLSLSTKKYKTSENSKKNTKNDTKKDLNKQSDSIKLNNKSFKSLLNEASIDVSIKKSPKSPKSPKKVGELKKTEQVANSEVSGYNSLENDEISNRGSPKVKEKVTLQPLGTSDESYIEKKQTSASEYVDSEKEIEKNLKKLAKEPLKNEEKVFKAAHYIPKTPNNENKTVTPSSPKKTTYTPRSVKHDCITTPRKPASELRKNVAAVRSSKNLPKATEQDTKQTTKLNEKPFSVTVTKSKPLQASDSQKSVINEFAKRASLGKTMAKSMVNLKKNDNNSSLESNTDQNKESTIPRTKSREQISVENKIKQLQAKRFNRLEKSKTLSEAGINKLKGFLDEKPLTSPVGAKSYKRESASKINISNKLSAKKRAISTDLSDFGEKEDRTDDQTEKTDSLESTKAEKNQMPLNTTYLKNEESIISKLDDAFSRKKLETVQEGSGSNEKSESDAEDTAGEVTVAATTRNETKDQTPAVLKQKKLVKKASPKKSNENVKSKFEATSKHALSNPHSTNDTVFDRLYENRSHSSTQSSVVSQTKPKYAFLKKRKKSTLIKKANENRLENISGNIQTATNDIIAKSSEKLKLFKRQKYLLMKNPQIVSDIVLKTPDNIKDSPTRQNAIEIMFILNDKNKLPLKYANEKRDEICVTSDENDTVMSHNQQNHPQFEIMFILNNNDHLKTPLDIEKRRLNKDNHSVYNTSLSSSLVLSSEFYHSKNDDQMEMIVSHGASVMSFGHVDLYENKQFQLPNEISKPQIPYYHEHSSNIIKEIPTNSNLYNHNSYLELLNNSEYNINDEILLVEEQEKEGKFPKRRYLHSKICA